MKNKILMTMATILMLATAVTAQKNNNGNAKILGLDFKYDNNFPNLTSIDTDIILEGTKTQFIINKAYTSGILLSNGTIDLCSP